MTREQQQIHDWFHRILNHARGDMDEAQALRSRLAEAELVITNYRLASKPEYARAEERLAEAEALLRELQYRGSVIFETTAHHYWGPHPDRIAAHLTREGKP
jgi:hypothetical protein